MLKVLSCVGLEHNLWLVALSALICALGCFTTTTLADRARQNARTHPGRWLTAAALVFGGSVWSLHFVAMLAFTPSQGIAYDLSLTALSAVVACVGAMAALVTWHAPVPRILGILAGGLILGLAVTGMHYTGVAAMTSASFMLFETGYVVASVVVSIGFSALAFARGGDLRSLGRRCEVAAWLSLAICGLHFTGMTAVTVVPGIITGEGGTVLGTSTLGIIVGSVSVVILIAGLAAVVVEQYISQRALKELVRMRLLSNLAQEVLFIHRGGTVLEVNSAGDRLFRTGAGGIIGRTVASLFAKGDGAALDRWERCPPLERHPEELTAQAVDGSQVAVELSCQAIDYFGRPATAVALRDLTDRKRDEARIRHLARHDALTGLPNRYTLLERLDLALNTAAQQRSSVAVLFIDLDRFKPVNDLHGHAAGDAVLVQASKRILAEIQSSDTLARIGGDEFVMLLSSDPQPEKVSLVATRVIEALRKPFHIEGHRVDVGASVGIALYPEDGGNGDTLMRAADAAMYKVKESGRGTLRFYEASMNAHLQARLQLEQELAGAVERGELVLHYQPIVNGTTGEVETFEALIRWKHPRRGVVPPVEFIPLAEETGLIDGIGRWVIETALRDASGWEHPWRVSVNVSPVQFRQSDICQAIGTALQANGLKPACVVVEVTEGVLIDDAAKAVATLNRLRDMGVRVALDDFGTGYSSLSYLQLFKFDKFKIDKSFVRKLGQSEDALTLTRTIVNLGHNLGLQVTAEGVETPAQLAILQSLGCDQIQGYLIARPAPNGSHTELDRVRTVALFDKNRRRLSA